MKSGGWVAALVALLLWGCGGAPRTTNEAAAVALSPLAATLVLNQAQQFVASVSGTRVAAIQATNGAVRAANVVTITTTSEHSFAQGDPVTVSGVTDSSFNGTFTIASVPSKTTLTYSQSGPDATSGGGFISNNVVKWFVNDIEGGNTTVGTITTSGLYQAPSVLPPATTATIAANGAARASNVVTITTTAAHNLAVNQVVHITGVTDKSFNGTFVITEVPSATTFKFNQSGADATSGGGTVTSRAVRVKAVSAKDSSVSATAVVNINSGVSLQITPSSATLGTSETIQFVLTVTGTTNPAVDWFVDDIPGGNSTVGTISASGLYTAPAALPNVTTATIASNGARRQSNTVTITTTAAHGFTQFQIVTISGVADSSFNGTFAILSVPSTTTFTYSQVGADATSGGGTVTSQSRPVIIKATSVVDSTQSATASAQVVTVTDPTLTLVSPTKVAQGSVFEDLLVVGTGFISTTEVRVNGTPLPPGTTSVLSSTVISARLGASLLATPGALSVDVRRQGGTPTAPQVVTVESVRPALIAASPDSARQGGAPVAFNVNGGFYGTETTPTITGEFNGSARAVTVSATNTGRQASFTIGGTDLDQAGLFSVGIRSTSDPSLFAASNLAVQPSAGPTVVATLAVGALPGSIAVNTATGIAVVANRGSNNLTLIDLATMTVLPGTIPVGNGPTGVAVDEVRNLAVVANNNGGGAGSISVVNLETRAVTTITANVGNAPFAVGVNPLTGQALIAYQNTNHADLLDLTRTPPAIVATTTISTGNNPEVAVEPYLDWALVTPGGAGTLSVVNLSRRNVAAIESASRAAGVATITTTAGHSLQAGQAVLVDGVADPSFNGVFTVAAVPSNQTFTYVQPGAPNASSQGGTVASSRRVATVALDTNVRGIGINSFTQRAVLANPASTSILLFNLFDQVVTTLSLGTIGTAAAAFNSFTDIAITLNPNVNRASIIDPRTPAELFTVGVGAGARAVAVDPGTNLALVANETDGTVTVIQLSTSPIRALHLAHIVLPADRQIAPRITLSSGTDLPLTLLGKGFAAGATVRLNGVALLAPTTVTDRRLTVSVPAAMLAAPQRFAVDVVNTDGTRSNVLDLSVALAVDLAGAGGGCADPQPAGVAIDGERDIAVVTNSNCDSVSLVDLKPGTIGTVIGTITVGDNPQGVAVSSRLGAAVVANRGSSNASIIDLAASPPAVTQTVATGSEPLGVAVDERGGQALVANAASESVSVFDAKAGGFAGTVAVTGRPVAVAVDPARSRAVIAQSSTNQVALVDLSSFSVRGSFSGTQLPTSAAFDPASGLFIANSSLANNMAFINADTLQVEFARGGINPTSVAVNYRSSALVTANTASGTISVMDLLERKIRSVLSLPAAPQFAVALHPRSNLMVVADTENDRTLLLPLPR